ncbi:MAG: hypothetical protein A4E65_03216 [Syntrophorhabdus sp. PtaU1.Bin153]|nr:MAG: hypothetical protein A4E65_03216 [Syntrophorhabdus sp. PtaU1.Bin153]
MRLESVLFKGNITVKSVCTKGHELVMETDPNDSVPGSLYVTPKDVIAMIKLLTAPSVIGYLLMLPFHYGKFKRQQQEPEKGAEAWW